MSRRDGRVPVLTVVNNFATTNVDGTTWVQISAATGADVVRLSYLLPGTVGVYLGYGSSGNEQILCALLPGAPVEEAVLIPKGVRLVLKAVTATTISTGVLVLNLYN